MLKGTNQEIEFHSHRAKVEFVLSQESDETAVASAHLELARLHQTRLELARALKIARYADAAARIYRTDKES